MTATAIEPNRTDLEAALARANAAIAADDARKLRAERKAWANELPNCSMPCGNRERDELLKAIDAAKQSVLQAQQSLAIFDDNRNRMAARLGPRRDELTRKLRETAPQEITDAIECLKKEKAAAINGQKGQSTDSLRHGETKILSNNKSVGAFVKAAGAAETQINDLALKALEPRELKKQIEKILGGVPELDLTLIEVRA